MQGCGVVKPGSFRFPNVHQKIDGYFEGAKISQKSAPVAEKVAFVDMCTQKYMN